jgi:toxin ParE1/3/4
VSLPVEFSVRAEADLDGVADYIAFDNPRRAVSFVGRSRARCARIAEQPRANGSYLILYAARRGMLMIERVVHGARDLDRLEDG